MLRRSRPLVLLWVLAIALLTMRMADAHLHLCFDGSDRPVSLHVADVPTHHGEHDDSSGHQDQDLDFSSPLLIKKGGGSLDDATIAVLGAYVLAFVLPEIETVTPEFDFSTAPLVSVFHLRPPLRGPPL